jgi:hypothetical protein
MELEFNSMLLDFIYGFFDGAAVSCHVPRPHGTPYCANKTNNMN